MGRSREGGNAHQGHDEENDIGGLDQVGRAFAHEVARSEIRPGTQEHEKAARGEEPAQIDVPDLQRLDHEMKKQHRGQCQDGYYGMSIRPAQNEWLARCGEAYADPHNSDQQ